MSTHPYIPLYVDDYDAATAHLTPAQDGVYGRLLRLAWRTPGCSLPNDEAWIARKVRLNGAEWQRIGKPVIEEFFRLQRGRLVQKRLKAEYDDISRKKSARKAAGKKGGDAKARKTQENVPSIATDLPADTRAFPDPYPDPEREVEESTSLSGETPASEPKGKPTKRAGPIPDGFPDADAIGAARAMVTTAGADLDVEAHAKRFRAHAETNDRKAKDWGAAWRGWVEIELEKAPQAQAAQPATSGWQGPTDVLDAVRGSLPDPRYAETYLRACTWRDVPERAVVTASPTIADKLRECGPALQRIGVRLLLEREKAA